MTRFFSVFHFDIRFQIRHGFYLVYSILTLIYILILHIAVPDAQKMYALLYILYTDIAGLGFFFSVAVVLLEKEQNIVQALACTPLSVLEYLISKTLSLLVITFVFAFLLIGIYHQSVPHPLLLLVALLFNSLLFTLFGMVLSARAVNINQYFSRGLIWGLLLLSTLPLELLPQRPLLVSLLPANAGFAVFVLPQLGHGHTAAIALGLLSVLAWIGVLLRLSWLRVNRYVFGHIDGGVK